MLVGKGDSHIDVSRTISTEGYVAASNAPKQCTEATPFCILAQQLQAPAKKGCRTEGGEGGFWIFQDTVILQTNQEERAAKEKEERQFGK
jgi:hypothetical protein